MKINRYEGNDNYGKPKVEYLNKVNVMTDEELFDETKHKIWLSAYAANNPRSDYHWHVNALYEQWVMRNDVDGYKKAFDVVMNGL